MYLMIQVSGAGNQEMQLGRGFCQEHVVAELQITFLMSLSYAPSITLQFSLVPVRLSPAIALVHDAFHKTYLFTMNSDKQKIIC